MGDVVPQAYVEIGVGNFYTDVWHSHSIEMKNNDELDYYAGYNFSFSETINADIGVTLYIYPVDDDTAETLVGLNIDTLFEPNFYAYRDFYLKTMTLEGTGSYSFPLSKKVSLDTGLDARHTAPDAGNTTQSINLSATIATALRENMVGYIDRLQLHSFARKYAQQ